MDVDDFKGCHRFSMINKDNNEEIDIHFYYFSLSMDRSAISGRYPFMKLLNKRKDVTNLFGEYTTYFFMNPLSVRRYKLEVLLPRVSQLEGSFY